MDRINIVMQLLVQNYGNLSLMVCAYQKLVVYC